MAFAVGAATAASCSIITSPSDYQGEATASTGGTAGGTPVDAGFDADLPSNVVLRVFALGGDRDGIDDFSNTVTDVWLADITDEGVFGPWRTTTPLIYGGKFAGAIAFGKLFALGRSPTVDSSNRFIALAAPPGGSGVGEWSGVTDTGTISDDDLVPFIIGEFGYAVGGLYSTTTDAGSQTVYEDDVMVTRLDPDAAAILPWTVAERLNTGRRRAGVMVLEDHLWVIAGQRGSSTRLAGIEGAPINLTDGSLQPFVEYTPIGDLDADGGTIEHQVVWPTVCGHGTHIYVLGGGTDAGPSDEVWFTSYDATGDMLSPWQQTTALPRGLEAASCLVHGDQIYILGGIGTSSRSDEVMSTTVAADGTLADWTVLDDKLPFGRSHMAVTGLTPP